ncbi:Stonustoxin subunit alpha [Anabarilius grahami]|uniref:Stonustoxin subunit alpha n=1 Tax=Anabarilius grahami TaxID=495550 RepID=A0A3N0YV56_ANAGA|nr:Stonustoxin subunit alpha [Anabarilius grahami]
MAHDTQRSERFALADLHGLPECRADLRLCFYTQVAAGQQQRGLKLPGERRVTTGVSTRSLLPAVKTAFQRSKAHRTGHSHQLTLDLNTVNEYLRLSERNRVISYTRKVQPYPDHPDRFDYWEQVLCRDSVCGRCYWEIEWSGLFGVFVSLSYKRIRRKGWGDECWFGYNDQCWSLFCSSSSYSFRHHKIETKLPVESTSRRIGVYVDHSAGFLFFYSISGDTMILIHTVQTTFTQPLYPGFKIYRGSSVKLC